MVRGERELSTVIFLRPRHKKSGLFRIREDDVTEALRFPKWAFRRERGRVLS